MVYHYSLSHTHTQLMLGACNGFDATIKYFEWDQTVNTSRRLRIYLE